ncbi:Uncharacterised protein [Streptococcus pneumoniae]|nr:Uncharacterised protein [Streptococcus pneumoniae]
MGDDAADAGDVAVVQQPQRGDGRARLVLDPQVDGGRLEVAAVQVQVGAVLLDDEHQRPQLPEAVGRRPVELVEARGMDGRGGAGCGGGRRGGGALGHEPMVPRERPTPGARRAPECSGVAESTAELTLLATATALRRVTSAADSQPSSRRNGTGTGSG